MAAPRHPLRDRILTRIRRGELASVREIMLVASIPSQTTNRWLREAGIDLAAMRMRLVAKMHTQEEQYLASRGGPGLLADIPLGRVASPDEIAALMVWPPIIVRASGVTPWERKFMASLGAGFVTA